jgi:hypothetical protein
MCEKTVGFAGAPLCRMNPLTSVGSNVQIALLPLKQGVPISPQVQFRSSVKMCPLAAQHRLLSLCAACRWIISVHGTKSAPLAQQQQLAKRLLWKMRGSVPGVVADGPGSSWHARILDFFTAELHSK